MGTISLEELWPERFGNPDLAGPISPLGLPKRAGITRIGFKRGSGGELVFERDTIVDVRLCERVWQYRQPPHTSDIQSERRWRLEFCVDIRRASPIEPGHELVVAQEPYSNGWLQRVRFKRYTKKSGKEHHVPLIPKLKKGSDAVAWIEENAKYDPWENGSKLVAGISDPNGLPFENHKNRAQDLVLGVCPDFEMCVDELYQSGEIKRLLLQTKDDRIVFWQSRKVKNRPKLDSEVKRDAPWLMLIAVRQALAGPRGSPDKWIGRPVWMLAGEIYRNHLNNHNRSAVRKLKRERPLFSNDERIQFRRRDREGY